MSQWSVNPVLPWPAIILIGLGLVGMIYLLGVGGELSVRRRRTLRILRTVSLVLLLVGMVRPGCVTMVRKPQHATLALLVDVSRSQQLAHTAGGLSRWDKLRREIDSSRSRLGQLAERFDVRWFGFDSELRPLESQGGVPVLPEEPEGSQTDYGQALIEAARMVRGERLAGMVMLGDGVQNIDDPQVELPRALSEFASLQSPLYTVPFGQAGEGDSQADVAVTNLPDQFAVFVKNELAVQGTVRVRGFVNQEIRVQLVRQDADGSEQTLDTQTITARQAVEEIPVTMSYTPEDPGEFQLVLRAETQGREVVTSNNELPAFLTVYEGGLRVLYLEGELNFEQRYLRRSLDASQDMEVDFLWIDHRNRDRWPLDLTQSLGNESYDVFLIGDLDSRALHQPGRFEDNLKLLAERVSRGAGLVMMGGEHSFGPGRYHSTPLADLLPIQMQPYEAQDFDAPVNQALHLDRELTLRAAEPHYLTRLAPTGTVQQWSELPPLLGANRLLGVKPRAQVLLETQRGEPILVTGNVGGRVVAFAGDTTWRWWTYSHEDVHRRFWRQVVLWAAGLDGMNRNNVVLNLPQRRLSPGSPLSFTVSARTSAGELLADAEFEGMLTTPSGKKVPLVVPTQGDERVVRVEGRELLEPGRYEIEMLATGGGQDLGDARIEFIVFDDDREKARPAAEPERLARMAEATAEFGGEMVSPDSLADLFDRLLDSPVELEIDIPQRWSLGDTLWDGALFLLAFVSALGGEWWLRKRWGLV